MPVSSGAFWVEHAWITDARQSQILDLLGRKQLRPTYLYVVSIGAGLSEDGRDGWVTANFQIIFGALLSLKKISKEACWISEKARSNIAIVLL